ncbi:MAG: D-alanyl-D-alanine carboxypeptidase family protein [Rickettsiales bacterium]|jgi:D-alanyl-D-alanine dipeptidase|nr:D-alanyl-D-alanine carboxypeptidase family protein [Rickettsiales bacterium]
MRILIIAFLSFALSLSVLMGMAYLRSRDGGPPDVVVVSIPPLALEDSAIFKQNEGAASLDYFERNFPLVKVSSPWFINDLSYAKAENFLRHPFYYKFGVDACYVHRDVYPNMIRLEELLRDSRVRAVVFDCFRPHEAQLYMWKFRPDPKFVANPHRGGSMHSKGLALDIGLADMDGKKLEFATGMDHFVASSSHGYECAKGEEAKCRNREFLKSLMEAAGFRSIKHEWWHYQIPGDARGYPLIKVCGRKDSPCVKE